jgi:hypothetical protein
MLEIACPLGLSGKNGSTLVRIPPNPDYLLSHYQPVGGTKNRVKYGSNPTGPKNNYQSCSSRFALKQLLPSIIGLVYHKEITGSPLPIYPGSIVTMKYFTELNILLYNYIIILHDTSIGKSADFDSSHSRIRLMLTYSKQGVYFDAFNFDI